ncbi:MAG TPA: hypothetical protein VK821_19070 [Dehalococcoidia bacterium]|nr:hypothetical protein [Dehalococcoidia bacterium]
MTEQRYDPELAPAAADWLELDESIQMNLVEAYHRRRRIRPE